MSRLKRTIETYSKYVIQQSRGNLSKNKSNGSKSLYNSLKYLIKQNKDSGGRFESGFNVGFSMDNYGEFQDKGVHGVNSSYVENKKTKFKYKKSSNLIGLEAATGTFAKFAKRKGLKFRDKKGRYITYESTGFVLAQGIKKKGLKATGFFSKPLQAGIDKYGSQFAVSMLEDALDIIFKETN
ncbi:MAG: hypothetical protein K4H23_04330 [Mollicutes bacterium PWAP]|nr:hypothetical protein [Mollicutes bacterium PWAP]